MINIESKMQKGGRVSYNGRRWVGTHSASIYEAKALTLLGLQPTKTGLTSMNSRVYNRIASYNSNYNNKLIRLYDMLASEEKKKKVYDYLQRASNERESQNQNFEKKSNRPNDMGHLKYREFIENALRQIKFGPNTLTTPSSVRQSQENPPGLVKQPISNTPFSNTPFRQTQIRRQLFSGKETAGNKFKKTKRRKRRVTRRDNKRRIAKISK